MCLQKLLLVTRRPYDNIFQGLQGRALSTLLVFCNSYSISFLALPAFKPLTAYIT